MADIKDNGKICPACDDCPKWQTTPDGWDDKCTETSIFGCPYFREELLKRVKEQKEGR